MALGFSSRSRVGEAEVGSCDTSACKERSFMYVCGCVHIYTPSG